MSQNKAGLDGVVAGESSICLIDGDAQKLYYRGYNVADLAQNSTFEEVSYLLLKGKLPTQAEYQQFQSELQKHYTLPDSVVNYLKSLNTNTPSMDVLRTAISLSSEVFGNSAIDFSVDADFAKSMQLLVQAPLIVANYYRVSQGLDVIQPRQDLSISANFLYMLGGEVPSPEYIKFFDICLILHADHGFNASTFTSRVIAGTCSDIHSAIVGAIGALKGPLHGGANQKVKVMLNEIDSIDSVESYVRDTLANGKKIFGFGHRVYRNCEDPRAVILKETAQSLSQITGDSSGFDISMKIREVMHQIGEEKGKPLYPNVDFFSATVYTLLNIDESLFTPIFAMSRMAGWCAHVIEQHSNNRLIRPVEDYTGDRDLTYTSIADRN